MRSALRELRSTEAAKQAVLNPIATGVALVSNLRSIDVVSFYFPLDCIVKSALSSAPEPETASPTGVETPLHPDETPIDPAAVKPRLERQLSNRPDKHDLVEKNILKGMYRLTVDVVITT